MNVSTREFQLKQKEYLERVDAGEEIVLTLRNIPVAYVTKQKAEKSVDVEQVRMIVRMVLEEMKTGTMPVEKKIEIPTPGDDVLVMEEPAPDSMQVWCQLHFEKGKVYPCRKISYEDENQYEVIKNKWACPKCIEEYQNKGVGRVYFV